MHTVTINGRPVVVAWNQGAQRRLVFRASKHEIKVDARSLFTPAKAAAAYVELLWLLLPPDEHARYASPEDLAAVIDHENDSPAIVAAVLDVVGQMFADVEKKTSSANTHSPASNSGSAQTNGTASTRKQPAKSRSLGKSGKSAKKSASRRSATLSPPRAA